MGANTRWEPAHSSHAPVFPESVSSPWTVRYVGPPIRGKGPSVSGRDHGAVHRSGIIRPCVRDRAPFCGDPTVEFGRSSASSIAVVVFET